MEIILCDHPGGYRLDDLLINNIPRGWEEFFESHVITEIATRLEKEVVWPRLSDVFNAFYMCEVPRVVIVGQDGYPNENGYGLAFSARPTAKKLPLTLQNIQKKVRQEGYDMRSGCLEGWARQGVLLLNVALTVGTKPGSHLKLWEPFTRALFEYLSKREKLVWILWGRKAQSYLKHINPRHQIITGEHPSPIIPRGKFMENNYFKLANQFLTPPLINWEN